MILFCSIGPKVDSSQRRSAPNGSRSPRVVFVIAAAFACSLFNQAIGNEIHLFSEATSAKEFNNSAASQR